MKSFRNSIFNRNKGGTIKKVVDDGPLSTTTANNNNNNQSQQQPDTEKNGGGTPLPAQVKSTKGKVVEVLKSKVLSNPVSPSIAPTAIPVETPLNFAPLSPQDLDAISLISPRTASSDGSFELPSDDYSGCIFPYDVESFTLDVVQTSLRTLKQYQPIAQHEASDLLISVIAHAVFVTISTSLMPYHNQVSAYDNEHLAKLIRSRIMPVANNVLQNKKRIMQEAKCVVGPISTCSMTGQRESNEDKHAAFSYVNQVVGSNSSEALSFFAVFDGHGGPECSTFLSSHLHLNVIRHPLIFADPRVAIKEAFLSTQEQWRRESSYKNWANSCGSTAVTTILQDRNLYISWAGDSSAFLFLKNGISLDFVFPHKPSFDNEKKRIEELGGFVQNDRVNGILAVSRSFGDLKYGCVNPEPDIMEYTLTGNELFMILACDGLTDVLEPTEVFEIVKRHLSEGHSGQSISKLLVEESLQRGSNDNVTVVYVPLDSHVQFSQHSIDDTIFLSPPTEDETVHWDGKTASATSLKSNQLTKTPVVKKSMDTVAVAPEDSSSQLKSSSEPESATSTTTSSTHAPLSVNIDFTPPRYSEAQTIDRKASGENSPRTRAATVILDPSRSRTESNSSSLVKNRTKRADGKERPYSTAFNVSDLQALTERSKLNPAERSIQTAMVTDNPFGNDFNISELMALTELSRQMTETSTQASSRSQLYMPDSNYSTNISTPADEVDDIMNSYHQ